MLTYLFLAAAFFVTTITASKTPRAGPRLIRFPGFKPAPPASLALAHDIELFATCLRAGLGPARAASATSAVSELSAWSDAAALLNVGVPASQAWEPVRVVPGLEELAALVTMSEHSGAAIAAGADRISAGLRDTAADAATARAERAGVFISLPLALCFLPAFIVLGLVPIVISLGTDLLSH